MTTTMPGKAPSFSKHVHVGQPQTYDELLDADTREVPQFIRDHGPTDVGPRQVPTRWYLDRAVHDLEVEHIWKRTWQLVCRLEDVAEVGDTFVYDIADMSFIVVRSSRTELKAFWNACLHRAIPLRKCSGRVASLQCPFHGFTWGLDGTSKLIPCPEEFPDIDPGSFSLPEVQVATWEGFVMLNPDPDAESLPDYMGGMPAEFERWPYTGRYKALHFAKVFPTNWKVLQEAFMEAYHVLTTHPQFTVNTSERCSQFGSHGNYSRGVQAQGQTSDYVPWTPSEQDIFDRVNRVWEDASRPSEYLLPEGVTARQAVAEQGRAMLRPVLGDFVDEMSDAETVDIFYYTLFPNFHPFAGFSQPIVYKFYPYGDDHTQSVMETMVLAPFPAGAPMPPPGELVWIPEGEDFTYIKELGWLGSFLSQDIANMHSAMKGLRNNQAGVVNFASVQESKISHFYSVYERLTGLSAKDEIAGRASGRTSPHHG